MTASKCCDPWDLEEVLCDHSLVYKAAVIGVRDDMNGQPLGFVILNSHATATQAELERQLVDDVRSWIGPFACMEHVLIVETLPKTRSGKVLRVLIRSIANHDTYKLYNTKYQQH